MGSYITVINVTLIVSQACLLYVHRRRGRYLLLVLLLFYVQRLKVMHLSSPHRIYDTLNVCMSGLCWGEETPNKVVAINF